MTDVGASIVAAVLGLSGIIITAILRRGSGSTNGVLALKDRVERLENDGVQRGVCDSRHESLHSWIKEIAEGLGDVKRAVNELAKTVAVLVSKMEGS